MTTSAIERAQQQVASDRQKIGETANELRQLVRDHVDEAKTAVDPRTYARQYPWLALGLVFGAGIAIAMTGAERAVGGAIGDKAVDAKDFIVDKVKGEEPDPLIYADGGADHPIEWPTTIGERLLGAVDAVAYRAFKPVLDEMRQTLDSAPQRESRG